MRSCRRDDSVALWLRRESDASSLAVRANSTRLVTAAGEMVHITSLDREDATRSWPSPDFVKIDAEGEEDRIPRRNSLAAYATWRAADQPVATRCAAHTFALGSLRAACARAPTAGRLIDVGPRCVGMRSARRKRCRVAAPHPNFKAAKSGFAGFTPE